MNDTATRATESDTEPDTEPDEPDAAELARLAIRRRVKARRDEWRARRVFIDGRLVAPIPEPWHGKSWVYDDYACRCQPCCTAKVEATNAWRARTGRNGHERVRR